MPFNINNVDVTVSANVIYGITMVAITNVTSDPATLIDTDVEVIRHILVGPTPIGDVGNI